MRASSAEEAQVRRARRACLAVGFLLAASALAAAASCASRPGVAREAARGSTWAGPAGADDLGLEEVLAAKDVVEGLPDGFEDGLAVPSECLDVRSEQREDGGVAGFVVRSNAARAYEEVRDALVAKGWAAVESGSGRSGSFSKASGPYRWAFVSSVGAGGCASVVVQYATAEEGS